MSKPQKNTSDASFCPECGRELHTELPEGLCPACLASLAMSSQDDETFFPEDTVYPTQMVEAAGSTIGRYRLLEQIGEGGFGVVYMAEQREPINRRVALKIIKLGMDTKQVIARFEAERQALALMDHPNIARVLDAGTTQSGRPFFVMELVRGVPITTFCDENKLTTHERLGLFTDVCAAVQHAHQKSIIHRDLKPNNVLVTMNDDKPMPKIIDFGIAKATAQKLTDLTLFTQFHQFVGTPAYMSPEQAQLNNKDVDTRSDIYALGVLLYEILTGKTPFDAQKLMAEGHEAVFRAIREDEPPRPSTRLNTLTREERTTAAQLRREAPEKLRSQLKGDLDWVVMKALEKDRTRRYDTANAFAADVQSFLQGDPVAAVPPSSLYRFRKFVRRNRMATAAGAAVVFALVLGLGLAMWSYGRERDARTVSEEQRRNAEEASTAAEAARSAEAEQRRLAQANALSARKLLYASDMKAAIAAARGVNTESAFELLDQHTPATGEADLRGWEWHYLDQLRHQEVATFRPGEGISEVDVSPDGRTIVVALKKSDGETNHGVIQFLDAKSGEPIDAISMPQYSWIGGFVYLDAGQSLAVEGGSIGVRLADFESKGSTPLFSEELFDHCWPPKLSSDGKWMIGGYPAIGDNRGRGFPQSRLVRCIEVETGDQIAERPFTSPDQRMLDHELRIAPDVSLVAVACDGNKVQLLSVPNLELVNTLKVVGSPTCLHWSGDSKSLAVACELPNIVQVWDRTSGMMRQLEGVQKSPSYDVCLSADGSLLATGSYDNLIILWDLQQEPPVERAIFRGHRALPTSIAFFPDGKTLVSADKDGTLKLWDTSAPKKSPLLQLADDIVGQIAFSPHGNHLAMNGADGVVRLYDPIGEKFVAALPPPVRPVEANQDVVRKNDPPLCFSTDGRILVAGNGDHSATVYDVVSRKPVVQLQGHSEVIHDVVVSPDGKTVFTVSEDATLKSWSAASGAVIESTPNPKAEEALYAVDCSADGRLLAVGGKHRGLTLHDAVTLAVITSLAEQENQSYRPPSINSVCFSPDGTQLVCGLQNEMILFEVPSLRPVETFSGLVGRVTSVDFSSDGKNIIGVSERGVSQLVNLNVLRAVGDIAGSGERLISAQFSPDGRSLAVTGLGTGIRILRLGTQRQP